MLAGPLGQEDFCAIEAIEATILFGIPFHRDSALHARPDQGLRLTEARVNEHLEANLSGGGDILSRLQETRNLGKSAALVRCSVSSRIWRDTSGITPVQVPASALRPPA